MEVLKLLNKSNPGSAVGAARSAVGFIPRILFQSLRRKIHFKSKLRLLCLGLVLESWEGNGDLSKINLFLCSADLLENTPGMTVGLVLLEVGIQGRNSTPRWGKKRDGEPLSSEQHQK